MTNTTQPNIATTLSISPQPYIPGNEPPTLTITLNLSAPAPITLLTFFGIFNPRLALQRRNFTLHAMSTTPPTPINLEITKGPKRPGFSRRMGRSDEQYYVTLYPGVDLQIQCPIRRTVRETGMSVFEAGHRYRLGISSEEKISRCWWGTKDEVLWDGEHANEGVEPAEGKVPVLIRADPVEFDVMDADVAGELD